MPGHTTPSTSPALCKVRCPVRYYRMAYQQQHRRPHCTQHSCSDLLPVVDGTVDATDTTNMTLITAVSNVKIVNMGFFLLRNSVRSDP